MFGHRIIGLVVAALAGAGPGAQRPDEDGFWHDVTLRLAGALPNEHPKLAPDEELHLGRSAGRRWRKYVLGFSTFFEPRSTGDWARDVKRRRQYNWMDDEGPPPAVKFIGEGKSVRIVLSPPAADGRKRSIGFDGRGLVLGR